MKFIAIIAFLIGGLSAGCTSDCERAADLAVQCTGLSDAEREAAVTTCEESTVEVNSACLDCQESADDPCNADCAAECT